MYRIVRNWLDRYFADEEAVLVALILAAGVIVLVTLGGVLAPFIASLILAFLLQGMVSHLERWRVPHLLAVSLATLLLVGLMVGTLIFLLPLLWKQAANLAGETPALLTALQRWLLQLPELYPELVSGEQVRRVLDMAANEIGQLGQVVVSASVSSLPNLVALMVYLVLVPLLVFFMLKDREELLTMVGSFLPRKRPVMDSIWHEMNDQIANYVRGKVMEILIITSLSAISFVTLGLNYAALLAIAVGLSVLIPYIGVTVVTIPVALVAYMQWGWGSEFIWVMVAYTIIQFFDGNILVPLLFSEAVKLHPIAILLAVFIFGGFWGFWGVFFAIPLATLVKAIYNAWPTHGEVADQSAATNGG